jgi:hypothetical protein
MDITKRKPHVYLRVGPSGSGHTGFIEDLASTCKLKLFMKHTVTPKKFCIDRGFTKFGKKVDHCKEPNMIAFDDFKASGMCRTRPIVYARWPTMTHTIVFSMNDKGMKSCGEVDADDVLRHAFPKGAFEAHSWMLYRMITEIHHMQADGKVRILACGGKKLEDAIVLTPEECIAREIKRVKDRSLVDE